MRSHLQPASGALLAALALAALTLAGPARALETKTESKTETKTKTSTETKSESHTWLGVGTQSLSDELRDGMSYKGNGVLVNQVIDEGPAAKAGVKEGDVIISLNGTTVNSPDELRDAVRAAKPNDKAKLDISRDGKRMTLPVTLGERTTTSYSTREEDGDESGPMVFKMDGMMPKIDMKELPLVTMPGRGRLGVQLQDLNADLGGYFGVPNGKGALIVEVSKDSPASRAGMKAGDVITKVDDQVVEGSDDAASAIREREGKVAFTIVRKGQKQTITADIERRADVQRVYRGRMPMSVQIAPMAPEPPYEHRTSELQKQMQELRDEIRQLREELKTKSKD
jgi:serine protease Do